jgi:hypothetical protein
MWYIQMGTPAKTEFYYHKEREFMKLTTYISAFALLLVAGSCSKDLGNYDYKEVNEIKIDSLLDGSHHTRRIYTVSFNDTLTLEPVITGTISKDDLSGLEFKWTVDGETVSTTPKLQYVANKKYGKLLADFVVTDKSTSVETTHSFFVDVVNPYKLGFYILSQKQNGDAVLYVRSTIKNNAIFEEVTIPILNPLGKNPISISSSRKYGNSSSDYYNQIVLGVRNATNPVAVLDSREFLPVLLYNQSSYVGDGSFNFDPVMLKMSPVMSDLVVFATNSDGKVFSLWKGAISQEQFDQDPLDYQMSGHGVANPYSWIQQLTSFYDVKNQKIRLLTRATTNPRVYFFERSIDQYTKNLDITAGQEYVFGAEASGIDTARFVYLMKSGNTLTSYKLGTSASLATEVVASELSKIAETTIADLSQLGAVNYDLSGRFWYVAIGHTIYRASVLGLDLQPFITLPEGASGLINKFHIANNRLLVSTYDDSSKKSSAYVYNLSDLTLMYSQHNLEQVVDLIVGI